jgi:hypothetical protein
MRITRIGELGRTLAVTNNRNTLLVTAYVIPSLPILVTLMMEAIWSFETSVVTRATWSNIREDDMIHTQEILSISGNPEIYYHIHKKKVKLSP